MSFHDLPTVDENSKISEESVLAVRMHFSRKNGFILRIDDPDYGIDVTMELITETSKATGQRFPAQIKSSSNLSSILIEKKNFISLSFPTSSLGYLCKHAPAYGLILVYDENKKTCYFDYVEEIVNRLTQEREDDEWKNQKTVAIHIATENVLNNQTIQSVHQKFLNRFQAHESLINKFGSKFDIPSLLRETTDKDEADDTAADLLKKYGTFLLNENDILRLYQLLAEVSFHEILFSKELIFIAAVVYSEMGKCLEGEFYLNKSEQITNQLTEKEVEILKFTRIKVDFLLGKRSKKEYQDDLRSMKAIIAQPHNAVQIQINLFYYEVLEHIESNEFNEKIEARMLQFFKEIDETDISESEKQIFKVFHAENMHMYISSRMLKYVSRLRVRESLGEEVSQSERINEMNKTNDGIQFLTMTVLEAYRLGKAEQNRFLQGYSHYILSRFFFSKEFDFMLLNFHDNNPSLNENYRRCFLQAIEAHNLFFGLGLLKEAYKALQNAFELSRLAKLWHNLDITAEAETEQILNNIRAAEYEMAIGKPFTSLVEKTYEELQITFHRREGEQFKYLSDEQIDSLSAAVLKIYNLPQERHIHIVNEIKSQRFYYTFCDTANFQLLCDVNPHQSPNTKYDCPTSYIFISKQTGMQSHTSTDVEELAKSFGAMKK